ncbi:hypothetical protein CAP35_06155 [Chitinophagaceae bacterium IBVUCB1]|nr:hypothetical protein CAP35_06155 [Chitinophagaceae bacterium IBVUCB1]
MMNKVIYIAIVLNVYAMAANAQEKLNKKDLQTLKERMEGNYSSKEQAAADSNYFNIVLHMKQIWAEDKDGYWLYVEQAMAQMPQKPYRQRIYHVYRQDNETLVSKVYEMKEPMRFAGAWKDAAKLGSLSKDSLIDRQGCAIYLKKNKAGDYYGSTPGKECLSSLRGATYATSEVVVNKDRLVSWDRGWDAADKQVWGAEKGGYIFIKE